MNRIFFVLSLSAAFSAGAQPPGATPLTEAAAVAAGLARDALAAVTQGTVGQARADAGEAGLWPNPTVDYEQERVNSAAGDLVEQRARLSQTFDVSGRRALRGEAASVRTDAVVSEMDVRRLEIATEIRRAFYELLFRQARLRTVEEWIERFDAVDAVVQKLEAAGEVSGYDRRRTARERAAARARAAVERAAYERAGARLAGLVGAAAFYDGRGVTGVLGPSEPPPIDQLFAAIKRRPDLVALERRAAAADLEGRAADRGWIPDVTLGVGPKRVEDGPLRESGVLFSVSVPLPIFDRQQFRRQRAAGQAQAARGEYGLALQRAEGELRGAWQQSRGLASAGTAFRGEANAQSAELVRIAQAAYRAGETGILELLDAYRAALDAEFTALELELSARRARIELDQLTGVIQ